MNMKKVLIPTKLDKFAGALLQDNNYTVVQDAETPIADLVAANSDAEALIVRSEKITPEIIDALPQLRLIVRAGAGFNTIDTKYARRKNIDVMNTPGANSNAVAEEVVGMMLAAIRQMIPADESTRAGNWEKKKFMGTELTGKTVGILGLGNIGQLVIKRLAGFEVKILGYDPMMSAALAEKLHVELVSVEEIFKRSDFVTLHIPENDETRGMINYKLISLLHEGAVLINCARAGILNEDDLRKVKAEKKIYFCNDVYPKDEAGDKPIKDIADIMLPHLGANTKEANFVAARRSAEQTIAYFEQGITSCVVNKEIPDDLDANYQKQAYVLTSIAHGYLGRNTQPSRIETSFYGKLSKFAKYLTTPIAAGVIEDYDAFHAISDASGFLATRGVELVNRDVDNNKHYGEAMTIDFFAGNDDAVEKVSVRGTLTEHNIMISRINNFDHLYLEPTGNNLFIEYADEPGVIGKIASILGEKNINITDIRAPQDLKRGMSLAVIKTSGEVPELIVEKIKEVVKATNAFQFRFNID